MSSSKKPNHGLWDFEFTLKAEAGHTEHSVAEVLDIVYKKWTFQKELGKEKNYLHWQGCGSLHKKQRETETHLIAQLIADTDCSHMSFRPVSSNGREKNFIENYCNKRDTRVDGPWHSWERPKEITKQLIEFKKFELRGYQKFILDECNNFEMRKIDLIYDKIGNLGKSIFAEYMEFEGLVEEVPPYRLMDDIFQWVYSRPKKKAYFFDLPRGMKKDKLGDLYAGIEIIKNGVCFDKRYQAKKCRFDRPRIFVFTNELPNLNLMSMDRWSIHRVNADYSLSTYEKSEESDYDDD